MPTRIVAFQIDPHAVGLEISDSTGRVEVCHRGLPREIFNFLLEEFDDTEAYGKQAAWKVLRVFWNLDQGISPLLRYFGRDICAQLAYNHRCDIDVDGKPFQIFYIPGKLLSLRDKKRQYTANFYGIDQYFPEGLFTPVDVLELQKYGMAVLDSFQQLGIYPDKLTSPIAAFDKYFSTWNTPTFRDIPEEVSVYAYRCAAKQWVEAHTLGFFKEGYDFDLSSAYPRQMLGLVDLRHGKWFKTHKEPPLQAHYGYFLCDVQIREDLKTSPILYRLTHGTTQTLLAPTGYFPEYLSLDEIKHIRQRELGKTTVLHGVYWVPQKIVYPLKEVLGRLIRQRDGLREGRSPIAELSNQTLKRTAASVYGRLGQIRDDGILGEKNCPPWFAQTSIETRLKVSDFILDHKLDSVVHVSTDGLINPSEITLTDADIAAGWKQTHHGRTLVLSSGNVFYGRHKPQGLNLEAAIELIASDLSGCYWQKIIPRRITLKEALDRDFNMLGNVHDTVTSLSLLTEQKRVFPKRPFTGRQVLRNQYPSRPYRFELGVNGGGVSE